MLDLGSGGSRRGPRVPSRVVELVDVSAAEPGALGIERRLPEGRTSVSVMHAIERDAAFERLGKGHLVAWGPEGRSLVFAANRSGPGECSRVRIRLVFVRTGKVSWALDDPRVLRPGALDQPEQCGHLLHRAVGRSFSASLSSDPSVWRTSCSTTWR